MYKMTCLILCFLFLGTFVAVAQQPEEAQARAQAARAARVDAMRQLGETIQGIKINSKTTVKDFVTESDEINASFVGFVGGFQQVGDPKHNADGTCEVTLTVSMNQIINWVSQTDRKYHSPNVSSQDAQWMQSQYAGKVFTATGTGAMKITPTNQYPTENFWQWVTPQGRAMAIRAAQVDAYRNVGEAVKGVKLTATTHVQDFVAVSDEIRTSFNGVIQGAKFVGQPVFKPEGIVEVTVEIDVNQVINGLVNTYQNSYHGNQWNEQNFQDIRKYSAPVFRATGSGVPHAKYIRKNSNQENFQPYPPIQPPVQPIEPPVIIEPVKPYVPEWADKTIEVVGNGAYPDYYYQNRGKAKSMGERAAQLDAYRLLAEQALGLRLKSNTTVQDFITEKDEISTKVHGYIKGAKFGQPIHDEANGMVTIKATLYLGDMWQIIEAHYRAQYPD